MGKKLIEAKAVIAEGSKVFRVEDNVEVTECSNPLIDYENISTTTWFEFESAAINLGNIIVFNGLVKKRIPFQVNLGSNKEGKLYTKLSVEAILTTVSEIEDMVKVKNIDCNVPINLETDFVELVSYEILKSIVTPIKEEGYKIGCNKKLVSGYHSVTVVRVNLKIVRIINVELK